MSKNPIKHRGVVDLGGALAVGHVLTTKNAFKIGFGLMLGVLTCLGLVGILGAIIWGVLL